MQIIYLQVYLQNRVTTVQHNNETMFLCVSTEKVSFAEQSLGTGGGKKITSLVPKLSRHM